VNCLDLNVDPNRRASKHVNDFRGLVPRNPPRCPKEQIEIAVASHRANAGRQRKSDASCYAPNQACFVELGGKAN
jgi:hypothetical protein